ncbi:TetR/AcrR family transcriptional regulator [Microbacterium sp. YY-01]|uniref:TetR/AcrR family transcriptional regulator n=1 Tax=Microbacterium sp. YY-01 TaxID=3421634 RepID=UPI003D172B28
MAVTNRREQILDAARTIAADQGLDHVSVRAVAAAAGIAPSTLRHYFATQAELHEALAEAMMTASFTDRRIHDATVDPADRLYECLYQFLPFDELPPGFASMWFAGYSSALGPQAAPAHQRLIVHAQKIGAQAVRRWLHTLATEGSVSPATIEPATTTLLAYLDGVTLHMLADPERVTIETAREGLRFTIRGVLYASSHDKPLL